MAMIDDEDELAVEPLEDEDEDDAEVFDNPNRGFANLFQVEDADGRVVMRRRPGARLSAEEAVNLAAWIVAVTDTDLDDFQTMVAAAVEGS